MSHHIFEKESSPQKFRFPGSLKEIKGGSQWSSGMRKWVPIQIQIENSRVPWGIFQLCQKTREQMKRVFLGRQKNIRIRLTLHVNETKKMVLIKTDSFCSAFFCCNLAFFLHHIFLRHYFKSILDLGLIDVNLAKIIRKLINSFLKFE